MHSPVEDEAGQILEREKEKSRCTAKKRGAASLTQEDQAGADTREVSELPLRQHSARGNQYAQVSALPTMRQGVKEEGENHGGSKLLLPQPRSLFCQSVEMANNSNIFRQAKQLLRDKPVLEMSEEELQIINTATMPLLLLRHFSDMTINDGLEELAKMVEEGKRSSEGDESDGL